MKYVLNVGGSNVVHLSPLTAQLKWIKATCNLLLYVALQLIKFLILYMRDY